MIADYIKRERESTQKQYIRETDRQTDRQTDREREREREKDMNWLKHRNSSISVILDLHISLLIGDYIERKRDRKSKRKIERDREREREIKQ